MGKWFKGAMMGAALGGSVEAKADMPVQTPEPVEQKAFVPIILKAEYRPVHVLNFETPTPEEHEGYEAVLLPFATPRYQYVESTPEGWHKEQTPEGSRFVRDCPEGFHEVRDHEGVLTYVQNNPDGSDDPAEQAKLKQDDDTTSKKKRRG